MIFSSLVLFTIAVLGIIAWISFSIMNRNSNNEPQSSTVKPPITNNDLGMEAGKELYPLEAGSKIVIPPITTSPQEQKKEIPAASSITRYMENEANFSPKRPTENNETIESSNSSLQSEERVIAIIPTTHHSSISLPIPIGDMLQELERSENNLQIDLLKELEDQLTDTAEILDQITEQLLISEMLHTMEGQFLKIQQSLSLDPLHKEDIDHELQRW